MFVLSKLFNALTQPASWLFLGWAWVLLIFYKDKTRGRHQLALIFAAFLALGIKAIPGAIVRDLESRYTDPMNAELNRFQGIIILGGSTDSAESFRSHGQVGLKESAERLTKPIELRKLRPELKIVFTGGEGTLIKTGMTEADLAERFYIGIGLDMNNTVFEARSRNTHENATHVAQLLGEQCKQNTWLLVTSAWHMQRAMNEFRKAGCAVTPYPVDFRTGKRLDWSDYSLVNGLQLWQLALTEWVGLAVSNLR